MDGERDRMLTMGRLRISVAKLAARHGDTRTVGIIVVVAAV
jgi:hypothetical protein